MPYLLANRTSQLGENSEKFEYLPALSLDLSATADQQLISSTIGLWSKQIRSDFKTPLIVVVFSGTWLMIN